MPNHDAPIHRPQPDRRRHEEVTTEQLEREIEQLAGEIDEIERQMPSADEIAHWRAMAAADKHRAWLITLTLKVAGTVTALIVIWTAGLDALRNVARFVGIIR
jgi:hypothetical protein